MRIRNVFLYVGILIYRQVPVTDGIIPQKLNLKMGMDFSGVV